MAKKAAVAALAADKQGKFWELHDLLFKNYTRLSEDKILELSRQVHLDMEKFERDQNDRQILRLIERDLRDASKAEVRGIPTVFINGRILRNLSPAGFETMIQDSLRKAKSSRDK